MALKRLKTKTSKRLKRKLRYNIDKKVREHHRKERRQAKKEAKGTRRQALFQVPNLCPFKKNVLCCIEAPKTQQEGEHKKQHEQLPVNEAKEESRLEIFDEISLQNPHPSSYRYESKMDQDYNYGAKLDKDMSLKQYYKEFIKVINNADVLLEVVDARDPLGTRCIEVEQVVRSASGNKHLVLVLNKVDLVPSDNLSQWLEYFRRLGPVTIFKASTQDQPKNIGRRKFKESIMCEKAINSSVCIGADLLMSMLGNYCRNKGMKTSILVGVVGIPNVGKSSIINSLTRRKACSVGCSPGVTKTTQEVELDSKIKLMDCPGIVFHKSCKNDIDSPVLKNTKSVGDVMDPISVAANILKRGSKEYFCKLYDIRDYETYEEFLAKKAARMGKFLKMGIPDIDSAAKSILNDWNTGKIKYYTQPPEIDRSNDVHLSAAIVFDEVKEFNAKNFETIANELMNQFDDNAQKMKFGGLSPKNQNPLKKDLEPKKGNILKSLETQKCNKRKQCKDEQSSKQDVVMTLEGNQCLNQTLKKQLKKGRKNNLRTVRKVTAIAEVIESFTLNSRRDASEDDHSMDNS